MSDSCNKRCQIPGRAIASILFACSSFLLLGLSGSVDWLPSEFVKGDVEVFNKVESLTRPIRDQLGIGCRVLAFLSVVWCVFSLSRSSSRIFESSGDNGPPCGVPSLRGSWRTEQRLAAIGASVFAAFALFCALPIVI